MPRKIIWAAVIIVFSSALLIVLCLAGLNAYPVWSAHKIAEIAPSVYIVPTQLADNSVATEEGTKLSYFGYEFDVPWNDFDEAASNVKHDPRFNRHTADLKWRSGRKITFSAYKDDPRLHEAPLSNELVREVLETTPDQISLLGSPLQVRKRARLLQFKADMLGSQYDSNSAIHLIRTQEFSGYESVFNRKDPDHILVYFFLPDGALTVTFMKESESSPPITQAEVNRFLQTLRTGATTTSD